MSIGDSRVEGGAAMNLLTRSTEAVCPSADRPELCVNRGRAVSELGEEGPL